MRGGYGGFCSTSTKVAWRPSCWSGTITSGHQQVTTHSTARKAPHVRDTHHPRTPVLRCRDPARLQDNQDHCPSLPSAQPRRTHALRLAHLAEPRPGTRLDRANGGTHLVRTPDHQSRHPPPGQAAPHIWPPPSHNTKGKKPTGRGSGLQNRRTGFDSPLPCESWMQSTGTGPKSPQKGDPAAPG